MDYAKALVEETRALGETARAADPAAPVPTCPGWGIHQLLTHVGRGHRWAATIVAERSAGPVDIRTVSDGKLPDTGVLTVAWLERTATSVVDAVAEVGDVPVWTFTGPQPASWWVRRRLHEATVHRADAALALGQEFRIAPELAADGVSEWLGLLAARPEGPLGPGQTLHLHATDDGLGAAGEWVVRGSEHGISWEHGHEKSTVAVRGTAADLLLNVTRRSAAGVEVLGDAQLWAGWLAGTGF